VAGRLLVLLGLVAVLASVAGAAGPPVTGALAQLAGTAGCAYEPPPAGDEPSPLAGKCAEARTLATPNALAVSPDGRTVYVAATADDAIAVFARDPARGTVRQTAGAAGCVSDLTDAGCTFAAPLVQVQAVAVSPDGRNVYAAGDQGVAVFSRDAATGALRPLAGKAACLSDGGDGDCTDATGMDDPAGIAISPDGRNAYVASASSGLVAVFARAADGSLTQLTGAAGCVAPPQGDDEGGPAPLPCDEAPVLAGGSSTRAPVVVSPDGRHVYVAGDGVVAVFARSSANGALAAASATCLAGPGAAAQGLKCGDARGLGTATGIAVSPDGRMLVVSSSPIVSAEGDLDAGIAVFRRDAAGALTQTGCITGAGRASCETGRGLATDAVAPYTPNEVAFSPDGASLYVATATSGEDNGTIAAFAVAAGTVKQLAGAPGCLGAAAGCTHVTGLLGTSAIVVSPDSRNVYAAGYLDGSLGVFARTGRSVRLTVRRVGAGTVRSVPAGIACGRQCAASFPAGSTVTLTAVPAAGRVFHGFTGACRSTTRRCTVGLRAAALVTATFARR
jgi:DNA-binding beta-propeller fold protein YncE